MRHGFLFGTGFSAPLLALLLAARWLFPSVDLSGFATREDIRLLAVEQKALKERLNALPFARPGKGATR